MEAFKIPNPLSSLTDCYPETNSVLEALRQGGEPARIALSQLWLSEGIPYAFRECPAVYEIVRTWLSSSLGVHAKEIGLTGSARIGKSLAPNKLGNPFDHNSDLDLFVVSSSLFEDLKDEFLKWSYDYERGVVKPKNDREVKFWSSNNSRGPRLIERGFIDQKMIPNLSQYPITKKVSQRMWLLVEKLKITNHAPQPKIASIRCYRCWNSFVRQQTLNLSALET